MSKSSILSFFSRRKKVVAQPASKLPALRILTLPEKQEISVMSLRQQMNNLRSTLDALASEYNPVAGLMSLFYQLVTSVNDIWVRFENSSCRILAEAEAEARRGIRDFNQAFLVDTYSRSLETAKQELHEQLYGAVKSFYLREKKRLADLAKVSRDLPGLRDSLWSYRIQITGDPDGPVKVHSRIAHFVMAVMLFFALGGIEGLAGYGLFEFAGSSYSAIAWSIVSVLILDLSAHFGGTSRAVINGQRFAKSIFAEKCPGGVTDANGSRVKVLPLDPSIRMTAQVSEAVFLLWSVGLVSYRIALSMQDDSLGYNAVFGAVGMSILAGLYYVGQVRYAPKHTHEQLTEFKTRTTRVAKAEALKKQLSNTPANDPFKTERETLVLVYNRKADNANLIVQHDITLRTHLVNAYLNLLSQYRSAYDLVRSVFQSQVSALGNLVSTTHNGINVHQYETPERAAEITRLFENHVVKTMETADNFERQAQNFNPVVDLPAIRLTDFNQAIQDLLARVRTEAGESNQQSGGSGTMAFGFNN